jgi:hypothetical protein
VLHVRDPRTMAQHKKHAGAHEQCEVRHTGAAREETPVLQYNVGPRGNILCYNAMWAPGLQYNVSPAGYSTMWTPRVTV